MGVWYKCKHLGQSNNQYLLSWNVVPLRIQILDIGESIAS